ncbi:S9 family peptidase [Sphingomonas sp. ID1715]|uniref:S9 family peptidase n=1 Tax=Sphingomonas sp. ID1715 TaxID=1656898 RepID=UPI001488937B|nr:S9 family peptidase [Sphingomonas sp. ID1715]NNM75374.1 S9 family peptidase [Sphingomonas sp. ID1715]
MRGILLASAALLGTAAMAAPIATPVKTITDPKSVTSPENPKAKAVPLTDLSAVRGMFGAALAPDGKSVVIAPNLTGRYNLWRVDLGGNFPVQLTSSNEAQTPFEVTPDNQVLFTQDSGGDELFDIYAVPLAGGAVVNLTSTSDAAESDPRLTPDGKGIVMTRRAKTGTVVDLAILDRAIGTVRLLTREADPSRVWQPVGFTDNGRTLIANRGEITSSRCTLYRIDLASGRATPLSKEEAGAIVLGAGVSADGKLLALSSNEGTGQLHAGIMNLATGKVRWVRPTPWEQFAGGFSPDGRMMAVQTNADGRSDLSIVDVASGEERPLAFAPGVNAFGNSAQPWTRDGRLLVLRNGADAPGDLWAVDPISGAAEQVTRLSIASLDPAGLPKSRIIAYRSADGTPISAILTIPFNLQRDGSNPAIVIPHGGPTSQAQDYFSRQATMFASRGYFVLQPNFRGSTGYGRDFQQANVKDLGGADLEDVVAGARFLAATGYVDPKRIGITGGSYGGFMTLMALAKRPDVFAAGVNQYGIINWFSMWENAVGGLREYQRGLVGDPIKDKAAYERQSPLTYVRQIRAPLLNLQGENDVRVPKGQTEEVVKLVKANGRTVDAVFYPAEGHGFAKSENQEDARRRTLEWFDRYLKPAPAK